MTFKVKNIAKLYLITKLQNLKAIHNILPVAARNSRVVSNYKITKSESYSQHIIEDDLKNVVVSNYKITKSESYSQPALRRCIGRHSCI